MEFERDDLNQMDAAARVETAQKAIGAGASPNEARKRWMDLGPVEGGETPYLQEQNWPLRLLAARELPARPPTEPAEMPEPEVEDDESEDTSPEDTSEPEDETAAVAEWVTKVAAFGLAG